MWEKDKPPQKGFHFEEQKTEYHINKFSSQAFRKQLPLEILNILYFIKLSYTWFLNESAS